MRSLLTVGCLLALSGCAIVVTGTDDVQVHSVFSSDTVTGNGVLGHDVRTVGAVSAIDVSGPIELNVRVGVAPSMEVDADSNLLPMIRTEVVGGVMRMWVQGSIRTSNSMRVTYTVPSLSYVNASGATRVTISDLNGAPLDFSKSGSGTVNLSGRVSRFDLRLSGSGHVNAAALKSGDANVSISGSSRTNLGQMQGNSLIASATGSSSLQVSGSVANVNAHASGAGGINLAALASEQAELIASGSGDITATVKRSVSAQSSGSGHITVYGNPAQRSVSGKNVTVLN